MPPAIPLLGERFLQMDDLLCRHRQFWQGLPFDCRDLPWRESHPLLCEWLDEQPLPALQSLKGDHRTLTAAVADWLPDVPQLQSLCEVPDSPQHSHRSDPALSRRVPGRKWSQIDSFNRGIPWSEGGRWLEWCAGKGHLGRVLASSRKVAVTSLERQSDLCTQGQGVSDRHQLDVHFVHGDAFSDESRPLFQACDHAVALHACGDLHVTLLRHSVAADVGAVSLSPCCYHKIRGNQYRPLSTRARSSPLTLSRHDLKLPVQETVTARGATRRRRFVEVSFRLGFDSLRRELCQTDSYQPVPSAQKSLLKEGFETFCRWAAEQVDLVLPPLTDFDRYQQDGEVRFSLVERVETIRTLFRRPLELWLVLDRALYLEQHGYEVSVTSFCPRRITPRNLLIHARRRPGGPAPDLG